MSNSLLTLGKRGLFYRNIFFEGSRRDFLATFRSEGGVVGAKVTVFSFIGGMVLAAALAHGRQGCKVVLVVFKRLARPQMKPLLEGNLVLKRLSRARKRCFQKETWSWQGFQDHLRNGPVFRLPVLFSLRLVLKVPVRSF